MGALLSRRKLHPRKLQDDPLQKTAYYNVKEYLRAKHIKQIINEWDISMKPKQTSQSIAQLLRPCFKVTPSTDSM